MKVRILRAIDDYELNIRHTDEVGEDEDMTDAQIEAMEQELQNVGRYWLDSERYCRPVRSEHRYR